MQLQWVQELSRITRPEGLFIASLHGKHLFPAEDPGVMEILKQEGFVYTRAAGTKGLPGFYQTSYHAEAYVRRRWGTYFTVLEMRPRAINTVQDAVICQKA